MLDDVIAELGIQCPTGSKFYAIADKSPGYLGCCGLDPNDSSQGVCPPELMEPASFDADAYAKIPSQDCSGDEKDRLWYTCTGTDPPFMGCCAQNPCANGSCPKDDLRPARVSNNKKNAAVFVGPWTTTTSTTTTTTTMVSRTASTTSIISTTPSVQPSASLINTNTPSLSGAPVGAIAGGVVGGVAALVGIFTFIFWLMKRKRRQNEESHPVQGHASHGFQGPYDKSCHGAQGENTPYSPSMTMSSPRSYYKPSQNYQPEHSEPVLAELPGSPSAATPSTVTPSSPPVRSPSNFGDGLGIRPPAYTAGTSGVSELEGHGK